MNIFLSMSESRSQSFKFKQPKVENIDGKSILTFETRDNGCITIISKQTIHENETGDYPWYFFEKDKNKFVFGYFDSFARRFFVRFTKNGAIDLIAYFFIHIDNVEQLARINDLTLDLSETTLENMFADARNEKNKITQQEKLEEILKKNCKSEPLKPEPPKQPEPPKPEPESHKQPEPPKPEPESPKQPEPPEPESHKSGWPSSLKWVLIVLGVLFMIGGFWVLNKESYEIVNEKQT
jgi:hypothetical protein